VRSPEQTAKIILLRLGLWPEMASSQGDIAAIIKESQGIPKRIRVKDPRTGKPGTLDYPVKAITFELPNGMVDKAKVDEIV